MFKNATSTSILAGVLLLFVGVTSAAEKLTNADVVTMVQAKVPQDVIIQKIADCEQHFFLFPEDLALLSRAGVPDDVIRAMAAKQAGRPFPPAAPVASVPPQQPSAATKNPKGNGTGEVGRAEIFAGYSYLNVDFNGIYGIPRQSANGWEAAVSGNFTKWLAVEFDGAGYYKTHDFDLTALSIGIVSLHVTDYSYLAGPRVNLRPLFLHALFGGDHLTGSASGYSASQDGFAGAVGGGVEWPVAQHVAVRASADDVFSRHNIFGGPSYTQNNFRAGAGVVYTFGGPMP